MSIRPMSPAELLAWLTTNAQALIVPVGLVLALSLIFLIYRTVRTGGLPRMAVAVAVTLTSAFSAEGMYEVAVERLGLPWYLASGLFLVAELSMLAAAARADRLYKTQGTLGRHGRLVWAIAVIAGIIVCTVGSNVTEVLLRLMLPTLVAALWSMGYGDDATVQRAATAITWTVSPRRILVRLGLAEAGDVGVSEAARERRIDQLTVAGYRVHGGKRLKAWRTRRLQRLALRADEDMVTEAARRIARVHSIVALTAPGAAPVAAEPAEVAPRVAALPVIPVGARLLRVVPKNAPVRRREPEPVVRPGTRLLPLAPPVRDLGSAEPKVRAPRVTKRPPSGRKAEATRELASGLVAAHPQWTKAQIAKRLGITERRLREVLAEPLASAEGSAQPAMELATA